MIIRRAVFYAMMPAAAVAPLAALVLHAVLQGPDAAQTLAAIVLSLFGFLGAAAVSALVLARRRVRDQRAVSWADAAVLIALAAAVILSGALAHPLFPVLAAVVLVGAFWLVVWELVTETRDRVRRFVGSLDPRVQPTTRGPQRGDVYVIHGSEHGTR